MTQEMTEEKAIERIKLALEWDDIYGHCYILQEDIDRQAFHMAIKALEEQPKKGKWNFVKFRVSDGDFNRGVECSCCKYVTVVDDFKYCPNCGAEMTEREK